MEFGTSPTASRCSLERVVRRPAYRGPLVAGTVDVESGGGMTGAAAGKS